jgi:hypothetical protein
VAAVLSRPSWTPPPPPIPIKKEKIGNQHFLDMRSNTCLPPTDFWEKKNKIEKRGNTPDINTKNMIILKCGTTYVSLQRPTTVGQYIKIFL